MAKTRIFSIGHSVHDLCRLVDLLEAAGATEVADVRSHPFSRRLSQFNQPELQEGLRQYGITYVFLGESLGGRPSQPDLYRAEGWVDYELVRQTTFFQEGIDALCRRIEQKVVAMLCSEEDPLDCHRGLMIAPVLVERGLATSHIRGNGSVETTEEFESRLLRETGEGAGILDGLFAASLTAEDRGHYLADAYRKQNRRKGFRLRPGEVIRSMPRHPDDDYHE